MALEWRASHLWNQEPFHDAVAGCDSEFDGLTPTGSLEIGQAL